MQNLKAQPVIYVSTKPVIEITMIYIISDHWRYWNKENRPFKYSQIKMTTK